ncbi:MULTISPECIES: Lrp/AsnC ligand binding domain-containing protein [Acidiplasma]|jgi:Lrp/AsnC family leucine-responsive transcriptional regulator|uniref:AsnC family transcriptional regulator n=2 Tax=Acidiplasma TaxID=507753 RepID=A0A0Q1B3T7_9ARCH|nr:MULTISPECIES: Lrp/AsnC ligand binding domain-containing protein [Acidiplasma]KJE48951.1 AsnC family transcriptional regulator [Acidiplasma sp. MBA-1]KPV47319.1 AsnC family transcriptional regulator [Acidiplasma aeolicum]KQB34509.1 AsnC family transcriptional regulator [Acidiplasma cupricumulans]KQB36434.1 AsnC family transcriptional regulator [Acidiplasma aeolicum]WMT54369.1 MAG: Lrp/AsnC ligand binding domain-containing protein [Acidiplasma sp.]
MEAEITNFKEYYDNKIVTAMIGIEADINMVEDIGEKIAENKNVEEIMVVTGDYDLLIKVRFPDYQTLEKFIVRELNNIQGIKKSKTMMVLSIIKDVYMR